MKEKRSLHHRRPKSLGGKTSRRNISNVSVVQHQAWHTLFGSREPEDIASYINAVWLDPAFRFVCVERVNLGEDRRQLKLGL
jgi:hypothetical protein